MSLKKNIKKAYSDGFTLVEIGIIVPILIIIAITLFNSLFAMLRSSATQKVDITITYDTQKALAALETDATLTSVFLPTTDASITDTYKPATNGGTWSYLGGSLSSPTRALIMRVYNTSTNPYSASRKPSYLSALGCGLSTLYFNSILQYNLIYFVSNGNLYRRVALDTTQATCDPVYQKQSCPSLDTLGTPSRDASCSADDELVAKNVTGFAVNYFSSQISAVPLSIYSSGADPNLVTTAAAIEVTVTATRKTYGQDITGSSTIRISRINKVME